MITTAIILAGGFGTRLQSVISDLPKPMAPVNGVPFLDYQLNYLKHFGIKEVIISTGYLSEKIRDHYQNRFNNLQIKYSHEQQPLGTGGGIRMAMEMAENSELLVLNGDSFFDVNISDFFSLHHKSNTQFSLALRKVANASRYGTIELDESNDIISFKEKSGLSASGLINGGVYILNRESFLKNTPAQTNFSIEKDFFEKQIGKLSIKGFEFEGYFIDIGIPEDYTKAQNDFKEFKYR